MQKIALEEVAMTKQLICRLFDEGYTIDYIANEMWTREKITRANARDFVEAVLIERSKRVK